MIKNAALLLVFLLCAPGLVAQQLKFKKGIIIDSVAVADSIPESYALYLPPAFDTSRNWPLLLVFDMEGRGSQALAMFREAAEESGFIMAASNAVSDSLSISDNILISNRLLKSVNAIFPIQKMRMYTAGLGPGGQLAALVPSFMSEVSGVIALGANVPNTEILNNKSPFYLLGIVGKGDFNYTGMQGTHEILNRRNFPNQLIVVDGPGGWPEAEYLALSLKLLNVHAIKNKHLAMDSVLLRENYREMLNRVDRLVQGRRMFMAYEMLEEVISIYEGLLETDSLERQLKDLRSDKLYRSQKRNENSVTFRESLIMEDYAYYLEEDVLTYNFNNLGWWNYQMEELAKFEKSGQLAERYMGQRLKGYLNALIEDQIDVLATPASTDEEALLFLYMLKTITAPGEYDYYLKIISLAAKYEDFGTALFYLEELLKQEYTNKAALYALENTALLRITPEYNSLIGKYLDDARYELIPE